MPLAFPKPVKRVKGERGQAFSHKQLVRVGRRWLTSKNVIVATEQSMQNSECPDCFAFDCYGVSTLIECKASRSDFLADRKKAFRQTPEIGLGTHRYYLAPKGMLKVEELPENFGLLEWDGRFITVARNSGRFEPNHAGEKLRLINLLRREDKSGNKMLAVRRYQFNRYETPSKNRATLGIQREAS